MMWYFQIFLLLFYFIEEEQSQYWNVINKAADYGHNVTLFCTINNCCDKNSGFDIFDPERRALWIDIRVVNVDLYAKYVPFTSKEGFGMTIRNVTKEDLGIGYGCTYGLDEGEPKILTETLAFKGPDWIVLRKIVIFGQHLTLLCPITKCCTELSTWQVYKTKQVEIYKNGSGLPSSKAKYVVGNSQNGFSLTIRHFAKEDLNINYACKYGKRLGNPKILSEDDAFKIDADGESNSGGNFVLNLVCGLLVIVIVPIVICVWTYKQRRKREPKRLNMAPCLRDEVSLSDHEIETLLPVENDSGLSPEEHNFIGIYRLCHEIGTNSVRQYFDRKIPSNKLYGHLNSNYATLKNNKIFTSEQLSILFPEPCSCGKSADFDFTLLYSLIRHTMATIIPPPKQGWGNQPQSGNITEEDDIERIRQYRNKMSHNTEFLFKDSEFNIMWADLSQAASRLSLESLAADISELKGQIFNCTNKTEVEKCIEADIKEIKDKIKVIKNHQEDLQENSDQHILKNIRGLPYEENNFIRIFLLCNKIGTESVRHYFDRKMPPNLLINHLNSNYSSLINNRRLTTEQILCLFPGPSSFGKSADFDFILLYSLIRNTLATIIPPPTQGWGNQPQSGNITEEDDIERIRQYRNKMAHNTEFHISDFEFNTMWSDLSQAVSRLSLGSLVADISELKGQTFNCTYKTEVEKCIKEDIKEIKDDIEAIKKDQSDLQENIKPMKDDIEVLIKHQSDLQENIKPMKEDLEVLIQENSDQHIPKNIRDQIEEVIQEWKKEDQNFVVTRASKFIKDKILSSNAVVVTGSSGSGKSSIVHHVALELNQHDQYEIVTCVTGPADIIRYYNSKKKQVFVIDDIFGKETINIQTINMWKDYTEKLKKIFWKEKTVERTDERIKTDTNCSTKIIVSCRLHIFRDHQIERLILFEQECNLLSPDLCLMPDERLLMLKQYISEDMIEMINEDIIDKFDFFPLLCKLSVGKSFDKIKLILSEPLDTIKN